MRSQNYHFWLSFLADSRFKLFQNVKCSNYLIQKVETKTIIVSRILTNREFEPGTNQRLDQEF